MVRLVTAAVAALVALAAFAQPRPRDLPPLLRTVSDEAGVLSVEQGLKLSRALDAIYEEDGIRVVAVIAETVAPETIEDYAERLSNRWARDRGIDSTRAIFIVLALHERELVVMPGRGLGMEKALSGPDMTTGLPSLFRQRRYFDALMLLAERAHGVIHRAAPNTK